MLKKTVSYEDFDGNPAQEVLHFHLSKTKLMDNIELKDELEALQNIISGDPEKELSTADVKRILNLVKEVMRLSYGVRSEDGKRFSQSPEVWADFQDTAVYDTFLFSLFENPDYANEFLLAVMPKDLREDLEKTTEYKEIRKQLDEAKAPEQLPDESPEEELARLRAKLADS